MRREYWSHAIDWIGERRRHEQNDRHQRHQHRPAARPAPDHQSRRRGDHETNDRGVVAEGHRCGANSHGHHQRQADPQMPGRAQRRQRPDQTEHEGGMADVGLRQIGPDRLVVDMQGLVERGAGRRLGAQDQTE
jgi:hypothetical protein